MDEDSIKEGIERASTAVGVVVELPAGDRRAAPPRRHVPPPPRRTGRGSGPPKHPISWRPLKMADRPRPAGPDIGRTMTSLRLCTAHLSGEVTRRSRIAA